MHRTNLRNHDLSMWQREEQVRQWRRGVTISRMSSYVQSRWLQRDERLAHYSQNQKVCDGGGLGFVPFSMVEFRRDFRASTRINGSVNLRRFSRVKDRGDEER